jgi:Flp pilus assembly protein TadB
MAPRTIGQRTKAYFGLADEATDSLNPLRQVIGAVVFLAIGAALCFWSLVVGLVVILVPIVGLVRLTVRRKEDRKHGTSS